MRYMFSKCEKLVNGSVIIPAELVSRWEEQMETDYDQLSEEEKESDRPFALGYMDIINDFNEGN